MSHYYKGDSIRTEELINFIDELIERIKPENIVNYICVMDNATYHVNGKGTRTKNNIINR